MASAIGDGAGAMDLAAFAKTQGLTAERALVDLSLVRAGEWTACAVFCSDGRVIIINFVINYNFVYFVNHLGFIHLL